MTSSWPWMKGVTVAVADPIDPVCPEDDRPAVKDLIQQHSTKIDKVKEGLQDHPLYDANKHDDLWILRFWLSHKKSKAAIDAAKHTLEFRKTHDLDSKDIRDLPPHRIKEGKVYEYLQCWKPDALNFTHPHPQRGVVCWLKFSSMDQHKVVEELSEDYWLPAFLASSEWSFQWLDYVTRTTGRLTKSVRFIDCDNIAMSGFNRECSRRDGKAMATMEDCYPQLLETLFLCNPPTFFKIIWTVVRVIMPKRVLDKFDMMNPRENEKERRRAYRHISEQDLPMKFGGKNPKSPEDW